MRGGAARVAELAGCVSRRAVAAAVQDGVVTRLRGGVLVLPGTSTALVAAAVHNGAVTCSSAAELHGLTVLRRPDVPHLAVPRSRGRTPSSVRDPFPAVLHRYDGTRRGARVVVPAPEALARMLICCPAREAIVSIDSALHLGRTTTAAVERQLPRRAEARARLLLRLSYGRAASPTETLARLALGATRLRVEVAVPVTAVGEVDLLVEGCVVVELDGFAYHSGPRAFASDRHRDRELVARGFTVLRFTYVDVVADPGCVVRAVRAALAARRQVHRQPLM